MQPVIIALKSQRLKKLKSTIQLFIKNKNRVYVELRIKWIRNEHKMNVYCRILNKEWGGYIEQIPDGIDITPHELIMKDFESYDLAIIVALFVALSLI